MIFVVYTNENYNKPIKYAMKTNVWYICFKSNGRKFCVKYWYFHTSKQILLYLIETCKYKTLMGRRFKKKNILQKLDSDR